MSDVTRAGTTKRWSDYTAFGGVVYMVEVPSNVETDMRDQTKQVLDSLEKMLVHANSGKDRILMATIYLCDIENDIQVFNEEWEAWIPEGTAPARACLEVSRLANKGFKLEIVLTAATK